MLHLHLLAVQRGVLAIKGGYHVTKIRKTPNREIAKLLEVISTTIWRKKRNLLFYTSEAQHLLTQSESQGGGRSRWLVYTMQD